MTSRSLHHRTQTRGRRTPPARCTPCRPARTRKRGRQPPPHAAEPHRMNERPRACLASWKPAAQKGSEKRPKSRPPPATAEMVQKATNEFHASAKAPPVTVLPLKARETRRQVG